MSKINKLITYSNIIDDIKNFRNHETYDEPGTFYFKLFFYFNNDKDDINSNLLGLDISSDNESIETDMGLISKSQPDMSWEPKNYHKAVQGLQDGIAESAAYSKNTAYNYLVLNGEMERAEYLKQFIYLLSDISANKPWYFQSVENIGDALSRTYQGNKEFKIEEQEKTIVIKCLADPVDNAITNMLELYRSACFSHIWKREVVPANLRKFDMGICIFQRARRFDQIYSTNNELNINNYKYIELIDCEIDPESVKNTYTTINNTEGVMIEPSITIRYSDCLMHNREESIGMYMGDLIELDLNPQINTAEALPEFISNDNLSESITTSISDYINNYQNSSIGLTTPQENLINTGLSNQEKILGSYNLYTNPDYPYRDRGFLEDLVNGTVGRAVTYGKSLITKAILGNVNGLSIRNMAGGIQQINSGDIVGGVSRTVNEVNKATSSESEMSKKDLGNVFADEAKISTMVRNI